ncbi:hypothetical protein Lalb_Chr07g0194301 [Lupinus albus]|uniref:Uncharacterized protein n=1 Tax=Lupinus albus TaxID=3870 RepID=A0A6A4QC09_LUPAL|nr:hypothetical protein Lalb_Chr07g0194301 [Lupinus albus]
MLAPLFLLNLRPWSSTSMDQSLVLLHIPQKSTQDLQNKHRLHNRLFIGNILVLLHQSVAAAELWHRSSKLIHIKLSHKYTMKFACG